MRTNPIYSSIDYEKEGIQHGFLRLPHSRDDSAWGAVMTPIMQIKNGNGPTALITGGNHGDEYEGPVALFNFAGRTEFDDIQGRVIVVPAMNYPAFQVASRVSPIDGVNLNRTFPGRPDGTVTQVLADYFSQTLLPLADYVLDIHSGGKTLDFVPFSASHQLDDKQQEEKCRAAMRAFGAPYYVSLLEIDAGGMYDTQAEEMGKVFVSTELGGCGTTRVESIEIAKRGVDNFLIHAGIFDGELKYGKQKPMCLDMTGTEAYHFCEHSGLIEPCVNLGDHVKKGDVIARIHIIERTAVPPYEYHAKCDGMVIARHVPSLVKMGDCLNVIASIIDDT